MLELRVAVRSNISTASPGRPRNEDNQNAANEWHILGDRLIPLAPLS